MTTEAATAESSRNAIMKMLNDAEVATVSTAEGSPHLTDGDEYIDLASLDRGVQRSGKGRATSVGNLLPRKAVHEQTWAKILDHLMAPVV